VDKSDIDEIIDEHLVHGRIVERSAHLKSATQSRLSIGRTGGRLEIVATIRGGAPRRRSGGASHPLTAGTLENKVVQTLAKA